MLLRSSNRRLPRAPNRSNQWRELTCSKCDKQVRSWGLCNAHYMQDYRAKQPDKKKEKLIAKGRKKEREYIIKQLEKLPIHLIRWEVISFIEREI